VDARFVIIRKRLIPQIDSCHRSITTPPFSFFYLGMYQLHISVYVYIYIDIVADADEDADADV
jgi:hypothetical protein